MTRILADIPTLDFRTSSSMPRATVRAVLLLITTALLLTGCVFAPPAARTPDPALAALADSISQIDGVQDAVAVAPYDGSPTAKSLTVRIYLDEPATGDLAAITTEALRLAWHFTDFSPVSYTAQVWNGPQQSPPYDNSKRVDLTTVLPELDLPDSRVYKGDLYPSISDLEAKFGARE